MAVGKIRHKENKGHLFREDEAGQQTGLCLRFLRQYGIKGSSPCFCRVLGQARCSWRASFRDERLKARGQIVRYSLCKSRAIDGAETATPR